MSNVNVTALEMTSESWQRWKCVFLRWPFSCSVPLVQWWMVWQVCRRGQGLDKGRREWSIGHSFVCICVCIYKRVCVSVQGSARGDTMCLSQLTAPRPQTTVHQPLLWACVLQAERVRAVHPLTHFFPLATLLQPTAHWPQGHRECVCVCNSVCMFVCVSQTEDQSS